jgi:hypothetical protein
MLGDDLTDEQLRALSPGERHYILHLRCVRRYQQKNKEKMHAKCAEYYQNMKANDPEKYDRYLKRQSAYGKSKRKEKKVTILEIEEIPNNEQFNKNIDIDNLSVCGEDLTDCEISGDE